MRKRMTSLSSSSCSSTSSSSSRSFYCVNTKSRCYLSKNRYQILRYEQICKLLHILDQKLMLVSTIPGLPSIHLKLRQFLNQIQRNFVSANICIEDIRLNGGGASYVIGSGDSSSYSDLDLIISLDSSSNDISDPECLRKIRNAILNSIIKSSSKIQHEQQQHDLENCNQNMFNSSNNCLGQFPTIIPESYIHKQIKINDSSNGDMWSLISFGSNYGDSRIVELKLVQKMRRKFEFSVDSFQIKLDSILAFLDRDSDMTSHFYPTVVAESVWGSFQEACIHLEEKLIMTEKPEEIRGGGLLKYCKLLVEGYQTHSDLDVLALERYMCSRFFIDFPDLEHQKQKLLSYLINHFPDNCDVRMRYLQTLEQVVSHSTVCLMNHERYQTLSLINGMIYDVWNCAQTPLHIDLFNDPNLWMLDHVFYGTSCSPATPLSPSNCPSTFSNSISSNINGSAKASKHGNKKGSQQITGVNGIRGTNKSNNNRYNSNKNNSETFNQTTKQKFATNQITKQKISTNQNTQSNSTNEMLITTSDLPIVMETN